jgi:hypothetical protein
MKAAVVTVLMIAVLMLVVFVIPRFLTLRAARKVVARFDKMGAVSPATAVTLEELGLAAKRPWDNMFRFRDYKPLAARLLGQAKVLRATEDGKVYLSKEDLEKSLLKKYAGPK